MPTQREKIIKPKLILREIAENIDLEELGHNWRGFDFESFSKSKKLYDFQKEALENVLKVLWFYYEKYFDFRKNEDLSVNDKRKEKLFREYLDYRLMENEVDHPYREEVKHRFIFDYFPLENQKISFKHFINRAGFWMATGSGKTLVIVKLIELLRELIKRGEIPDYDILFLTYRDDLIEQFKKHLEEYNESRENKILVYDLKDYEKVKRNSLFKENFVFYYRSDLFSNEEKEKILDFRNYFNDGKWYIVLDEAHKGDKEESKRQHIFSILSKNGFLFNFSATFDDIRDLVTTCFEYNLSTFIEKGYGKKIYISEYELKAFREELREKEKLKVILKSGIFLTYIKKNLEKIRKVKSNFYHNPLIMVLVNSVNNEVADLKIFFEHLRKIAKGEFQKELIEECKTELKKDFTEKIQLDIPEKENIKVDFEDLKEVTYEDVLFYVFNSKTPGEIEISYNPSQRGEVAFKLKTSDSHFALMKTGDMPKWLKEDLSKFEINHTFEDEKFFEKINSDNSPINILLGSRVFYEGWDSNRPNIILFINIGVGKEARKFVLQSIGRGVRIEPIKDERKRALYIKYKIGESVFEQIKNFVEPVETLFVFGTSKKVIETIVKEIGEFKKQGFKGREISLFRNIERIQNNPLLIPKYEPSSKKVFEERARFGISEEDFNLLKEFNSFLEDDRILAIEYDVEPRVIQFFRKSFSEQRELDGGEYYKKTEIARNNINIILKSLFSFWQENLEKIKEISELKDEIKHFERVVIEEAKFEKFRGVLSKFKERKIEKKKEKLLTEIREKLKGETILLKEIEERLKEKEKITFEDSLELKYISEHYYLPLIVSKDEKIGFIKHVIKTKSEVEVIQKLEDYLKKPDNKFQNFDWWMFSKIDESLDEVYIPYYDYEENFLKKFKPDFIFWLKKKNDYFIVFIDPKSTKFTNYQNKIDWYKKIFEEKESPKNFKYKNLNCFVYCFLATEDVDKVKGNAYAHYWFENFDKIFERIEKT
jgi:superfamily II DNA or RNA helicase